MDGNQNQFSASPPVDCNAMLDKKQGSVCRLILANSSNFKKKKTGNFKVFTIKSMVSLHKQGRIQICQFTVNGHL